MPAKRPPPVVLPVTSLPRCRLVMKRMGIALYGLCGATVSAVFAGTVFHGVKTVGDFVHGVALALFAGIAGLLVEVLLRELGGEL